MRAHIKSYITTHTRCRLIGRNFLLSDVRIEACLHQRVGELLVRFRANTGSSLKPKEIETQVFSKGVPRSTRSYIDIGLFGKPHKEKLRGFVEFNSDMLAALTTLSKKGRSILHLSILYSKSG